MVESLRQLERIKGLIPEYASVSSAEQGELDGWSSALLPTSVLSVDPINNFLYIVSTNSSSSTTTTSTSTSSSFTTPPPPILIRAFNLKSNKAKENRNEPLFIIPKPQLEHFTTITHSLLSPTCSYLAIWSPSRIAVVDLTSSTLPSSSPNNNNKFISAASAEVGANITRSLRYSPSGGRETVLHVLWHPLSSSHLCVLTSDCIFRIYNVSSNTSEPEQLINIASLPCSCSLLPAARHFSPAGRRTPPPPLPMPISFTFPFSSSSSNGNNPSNCWDLFSVIFMLENGSLAMVCPVIPFKIRLPAQLIRDLETSISISNNNEAKLWLEDVLETIPPLETSVINDPVRTTKPKRSQKKLILQGPVCADNNNNNNHNGEFCSLTCIPGAPKAIIRITSDGIADIFLSFSEASPCWVSENILEEDNDLENGTSTSSLRIVGNEETKPILYHTDHIDLSLSSLVKKHEPRYPLGFISNVSDFPDQIFIYHAEGTHSLSLDYLMEIRNSLRSGAAGGLSQISNSRLLQCFQSGDQSSILPCIGASTLHDPTEGETVLILLTIDGSIHIKRISVSTAPLRSLLSSSTITTNIKPETPPPKMLTLPSLPTLLQVKFPSNKPDECLTILQETCNKLRRTHEIYLRSLLVEVTARFSAARKFEAEFQERIKTIAITITQTRDKRQTLLSRIQKLTRAQTLLDQRASLILDTLAYLHPHITREERDYFHELEIAKQTIRILEENLHELQKRTVDEHDIVANADTDNSICLNERQENSIADKAKQELVKLESLVNKIKELKLDFDRFDEK